ncbi:MAG: hypothetical protein JXA72_11990 [Bacteroidales bacterium]|nr:hypothetical protein [Bacteroidales bacterium]
MKIEEVPQDKGYMIDGRISDLNYAVDEHGKYVSRQSRGWLPKNEAMTMAWDVVFERAEEVRKKIFSGELSPLAFYMELHVMDISILSSYTGIAKWKVKRHLMMKNFRKISTDKMVRYAEVFGISQAELQDTERIRTMVLKHED